MNFLSLKGNRSGNTMDNMQKKKFHITPHSSKDYEAMKHLSKLSGSSISEIGAVALHEWLEDNFIKEIEFAQAVQEITNLTNDSGQT